MSSNLQKQIEEFQNKWNYTRFTATLDKNLIQYASANCLGGGSEINSGLYHSISSDFLKKYNNNISKNYYDTKKIEELVNFSLEKKTVLDEGLTKVLFVYLIFIDIVFI